ncbi:MAG: methyltransferase domain-containing protein [Chloroflexota bacterium]|nr:methyltransferase domain-containing protein [Chloroflexota bacterium]
MSRQRSARKPSVAPSDEAEAGRPAPAPDWRASKLTQRRYDRQAWTYDLNPMQALMELAFAARLRRRQWEKVGGRVLEVGVGTGRNMPYHPAQADVTAVDLSPKLLRRAVGKAQKRGAGPEFALMDAQSLGLGEGGFDWAVTTFVFCSVPDPVRGLSEMRRVLKPGGRVILLEHVRSRNRILGWIMDRLNPLAVRLAGANINRDTVANVSRAGFEVTDVGSFMGGIVKLIEARKRG